MSTIQTALIREKEAHALAITRVSAHHPQARLCTHSALVDDLTWAASFLRTRSVLKYLRSLGAFNRALPPLLRQQEDMAQADTSEPTWEKHTLPSEGPNGKTAYTRPLLGSEMIWDQLHNLVDGLPEVCMGITFSTTFSGEELLARAKDAVIRWRFVCPIVAASAEFGVHHPKLRSWIYTPLANHDEARRWAEETVVMLDEVVDPSSFIQRMNATRLPYTLSDGTAQHVRVYIFRPSSLVNVFALFHHGPHSLLDAKPNMQAFAVLLDFMSSPQVPALADLKWGTEHQNLPPGPIAATGGRRKEWDTVGMALFAKAGEMLANPTPGHHLTRRPNADVGTGRVQRALVELTVAETTSISQALKRGRYGWGHLVEAATALALYNLKPVPEEQRESAHVTFNGSMISLHGKMSPPYNESKTHLVSSIAMVPVRISLAGLADLTPKERMFAALAQSKAHYDEYLANPCILQFSAEHMRIDPLLDVDAFGRPASGVVTNLGMVKQYLPTAWPRPGGDGGSSGPPVFRVDRLHFGHRLIPELPNVHVWSMNSRFSVQLQAADVWEEATPQEYLNEIIRQMLLIV
ncbi:hypothetical protein BD414DRAFT_472003 [Trametes punicea]|nr:hypothetical protein BD414DRAFT_472003 [Trametes punicea]